MEETDDIFSLVLLFLPQQEKPFDRDDDAVFPEKRKPMLNQLSILSCHAEACRSSPVARMRW
jgi:hypothetical protein